MAAGMRLPVPSSILLLLYFAIASGFASAASNEIHRGFSAAHDPSSYSQFQPLLADSTGVFALGFLRTELSNLDLAVLHVASSSALWRAAVSQRVRWDASASLSFNGCLVLSDDETGVLWSTAPVDSGDRVVLLNSLNIQVQEQAVAESVVAIWQSFDFSSDTLVQGQNFSSVSDLFSRDRRFSMKLGESYFAFYMDLLGGTTSIMYWKHAALEAKAQIVPDRGAIYARVGEGFLGMYQIETAPVDMLPFYTFNRRITGQARKVGYFKVRMSGSGGRRVKKAMLAVGGVLFTGAVVVAGYSVWMRQRGRRPVAYTDLNSASSQIG